MRVRESPLSLSLLNPQAGGSADTAALGLKIVVKTLLQQIKWHCVATANSLLLDGFSGVRGSGLGIRSLLGYKFQR